jgi:hypothetical protein
VSVLQRVLLLMMAEWEVQAADSGAARVAVDSGQKCITYHNGHRF